MTLRLTTICMTLALGVAMAGCAPVMVGSAAMTTAAIASDPRTTGEQLTDKEIQLKASSSLTERFGQQAQISTSPYDGKVLMVGTAATAEIREEAQKIVEQIPNVKSVVNRVTIGPSVAFSQMTSDTWLSSKVKTTLIATRGIPSNSVKVTAENDNIYLQGMLLPQQAQDVTKTVRAIPGVKEVFTLFDILTPQQTDRIRNVDDAGSSQRQSSASRTTPTSGNSTWSDSAPGASPSATPVVAPSTPQAIPI